jgi:hypothetical protein
MACLTRGEFRFQVPPAIRAIRLAVVPAVLRVPRLRHASGCKQEQNKHNKKRFPISTRQLD